MTRDWSFRIGLLALALVPVPLFWVLGERSLRALEAAELSLRGRQAVGELLEVVREEARAARAEGEGLPLGDAARTGVLERPDGAFLAHPALHAARALEAGGELVLALERLDPLLAGGAGPEAEAAARLVAADQLLAAGDVRRSAGLRRSAARLAERVARPEVARWIRLATMEGGDREPLVREWLDEVLERATDVEELVLLADLARRLPEGTAVRDALDDRRRWPERLGRLRARAPAAGSGLAVVAVPGAFFATDGATAWRLPGFADRLASVRPAGATARWNAAASDDSPPPASGGRRARSSDERRVVLSGVVASEGLRLDLGERSLVLELPPPRLFGTAAPRGWLAAGVSLWGVLALLLVFAVVRQERRARELVAAREDLVAQVAHELRTPLTVLRLYGESLAEERVDAARRPEYLRTIAAEAERLGRLVDRVAATARGDEAEDGTAAADTSCDAAAVVRRAAEPYRVAAEQTSGRLDVDVAREPVPVEIDAEELRLVLDVVLENALRHGGAPPRIRVSLAREGETVVCRVEDEGPGLDALDARDVERLFERWTRGRQAKGGAGMGLFLARRSARARGGDVTLEPTRGGGVAAVVRLKARAGPTNGFRSPETFEEPTCEPS